jgi:hypothetical protein
MSVSFMVATSIRTWFELHPKADCARAAYDRLKANPFIEGNRARVAPPDPQMHSGRL